MISGKPQAHTRAEGGDGGGPKAEAHAKTRQRRRTRSTDSSREVQNRRGDHTHTHAERTYAGKVQTKVGVGNSQRLRARSPQHPTHAKRNRKRLRGVKRRVRGSATALQHRLCAPLSRHSLQTQRVHTISYAFRTSLLSAQVTPSVPRARSFLPSTVPYTLQL